VAAQPAPSAAEIDWRLREQMPANAQAGLPSFCEGGYLPGGNTVAGSDGMVSQQSGGGQPLQASGLAARYEIDNELYLQGDVRLRQGSFQVTGTEARYRQAEGQVAITGPLVSRGDGFLLTGDSASYDVESGRLDINIATFLLHGPEMRG
jgi:LPS-assembly protein